MYSYQDFKKDYLQCSILKLIEFVVFIIVCVGFAFLPLFRLEFGVEEIIFSPFDLAIETVKCFFDNSAQATILNVPTNAIYQWCYMNVIVLLGLLAVAFATLWYFLRLIYVIFDFELFCKYGFFMRKRGQVNKYDEMNYDTVPGVFLLLCSYFFESIGMLALMETFMINDIDFYWIGYNMGFLMKYGVIIGVIVLIAALISTVVVIKRRRINRKVLQSSLK